jgi:hypothetical protein
MVLLTSIDGGINWTAQFAQSPGTRNYRNDISCPTENLGVVVGGDTILTRTDSGGNLFSNFTTDLATTRHIKLDKVRL